MIGIGDFQYWSTDWVGFSSFGDWRAGMICFGQNLIKVFALVFLISPFFPSDSGKIKQCKLFKCATGQQAWSYLSFIVKRFYNTASRYDNFHCRSDHISGRDEVNLCLYYHIKLKKKQLSVSKGKRYPMNLIYSSHRRLLKLLSGIHHRWSMGSSGNFNSYSIVMTNLEEHSSHVTPSVSTSAW